MTEPTGRPRDQRHRNRRRWAVGLGLAAAAGLVVAAVVAGVTPLDGGHESGPASAPQTAARDAQVARAVGYTPLSPQRIAELPEARYDAVIPGLLPYASTDVPAASRDVYTISTDTPIYDDARAPVARFAFTNFAERPTVIVPVRFDGPWALVMTPSRQTLPSQANGAAPAQTAGWIRADALHRTATLESRVVISVGEQKLFVEDFSGAVRQSFDVGVGAPSTPTPTGVTGYLQERYLDPQQGQSTYRIQLTSLHSSAQDEPYQGEDGGLIGMHYFTTHNGTVSHGCVRLSEQAIRAVDALPIGTSVTLVP